MRHTIVRIDQEPTSFIINECDKSGFFYRLQWNDRPECSMWHGPYTTEHGAINAVKRLGAIYQTRIGCIEVYHKRKDVSL